MKITLSKQQWENIGKKTGWIKTAETKKTYKDKNNSGRTITISGSDVIDPNLIYSATIRDELGTIESVFDGTLAEIYLAAKDHKFSMPESIKELQAKNLKVIKQADSKSIDSELKSKHPIIHLFLSRMPGYNSALDIIDNIKNNNVPPENAGITSDIVDQAKQIIQSKSQTNWNAASSKSVVKESFILDARVIAAIILIILGITIGKSMLKDVGNLKTMPSQAEQFEKQYLK